MNTIAPTRDDYSATVTALKATYGYHKTYTLRRDGQRRRVQELAQRHGLAENDHKGGYVLCTPSISYGWSVWEHGDEAVLLYRDGGMGWDRVILLGRDRAALAALRQTGIALGLVSLRKN